MNHGVKAREMYILFCAENELTYKLSVIAS